MRTGAKNVRKRLFSRARGCFHIVTCIVDIMHGKTKYSMNIYLTTTTKIQPHRGVHVCTRAIVGHISFDKHCIVCKTILSNGMLNWVISGCDLISRVG